MPRSILALIALTAVVLLGDAPLLIGTPSVVVYPLTVNDSSVDPEGSARIADAIASRIAGLGGVKVIPPRPGVARANFLTDARLAGADYYITGFLAGLGDGVSMILQVVSVEDGIVVYSDSAQVQTYADAASQGDVLRTAILRHASRSVTQIEALPTPNLPSPSPAPAGPQADLGRILGRRNRGTPAPATTHTPAAVAAAPQPVALVPLGGNAAADRRDAALKALAAALDRDGVRAALVAEAAPAAACSAGNAGAVLGGTLDVRTESGLFGRSSRATLRLIERDCTGKVMYDRTVARAASGGDGTAEAVRNAADAAVETYVHAH